MSEQKFTALYVGMKRENARLRKALQDIVAATDTPENPDALDMAAIATIAKNALKGKK